MTSPSEARSDRAFQIFNAVVSSSALSFLAWLLMFRSAPGAQESGLPDLSFMPGVNACFNALSAVLLTAGWLAIRRKAVQVHKYLMVSAFASSALFLVGYVAYHYVHGDTKYVGVGVIRSAYLAMLASHVLLSMVIVPMALTVFWLAWRQAFDRHRRIARVLLPIWLYVSVTGVLIYGMLHRGWLA